MTIDEQRRIALEELRGMLADGVDPVDAVAEAAKTSGLRTEVIEKIGHHLIAEQARLISEKRSDATRAARKHHPFVYIDRVVWEGVMQMRNVDKSESSTLGPQTQISRPTK